MRNFKLDPKIEKKIMLDSLTSFRFIAALFVFLYHGGIWTTYQTGYLGVSFFFILSGFILSFNYRSRLEKIDSDEMKKFYISRIAKIYPIHLLTFLLAVPYYFFIPLKHEPILYVFQAFTNLLLIHSFIPFGNISFNGVSWSLSDEMFFYLLFPFLLIMFMRHFKKVSVKFITASGLWIISILIIVYGFSENSPFNTWLTYYFPGVRLLEFLVGMILGLVFLETLERFSKWSVSLFTLLEFSSIFFLIIMVMLSPNILQNLRYGIIFMPMWCFLIFVFAFQKGIVSKFLSKRFLVYLGEISFSFYMIHNLVLSYLFFLWKLNLNTTFTLILCFTLSLILSSLLYHYYEEPMRKRTKEYLLKHLMRKKLGVKHKEAVWEV